MLKINLLTMNDINTIHDNIQQGINKESLKELAEKLKMQDENVSLSDVLDAIVDAIKDGPELPPIDNESFSNKSVQEALELLGLTEEQFNSLPEQMFIEDTNGFVLTKTYVRKQSETEWIVAFGASIGTDYGYGHQIERYNDKVTHIVFEA